MELQGITDVMGAEVARDLPKHEALDMAPCAQCARLLVDSRLSGNFAA